MSFGAFPDFLKESIPPEDIIDYIRESGNTDFASENYLELFPCLPESTAIILEHFHLDITFAEPIISLLEYAHNYIRDNGILKLTAELRTSFLDTPAVKAWIKTHYRDFDPAESAEVPLFAIQEAMSVLVLTSTTVGVPKDDLHTGNWDVSPGYYIATDQSSIIPEA